MNINWQPTKAIHKAAGILAAAYFLHGRADKFRVGTARGRAIAGALDQAADDLKDLAIKTRKEHPGEN